MDQLPALLQQILQAAGNTGSLGSFLLSLSTARRQSRLEELVAELEAAGHRVEDVVRVLEADGRRLDVLEVAVERSVTSPTEEKRQLLAKVARQSLEDEADIDLLQVILQTIESLEPIHVRTLVLFRTPRPMGGQFQGAAVSGAWKPEEIEQAWKGDLLAIGPVLADLLREGLIHDVSGGTWDGIGGDASWSVTEYGGRFLDSLSLGT